MLNRYFSLSAIGAIVITLSACGGGGGAGADAGAGGARAGAGAEAGAGPGGSLIPVGDTPPGADVPVVTVPPVVAAVPELGTALANTPISTVFLQTVAAGDQADEAAPGQANLWQLNPDMSLFDGYNSQFRTGDNGFSVGNGALKLTVGSAAFPTQPYASLTAYGPLLGAADGVKTVTVVAAAAATATAPATPAYAHIHQMRGVKKQRTLALSGTNTISWDASFFPPARYFTDEPFSWQVVLRDSTGLLLRTLYRNDETNGETGESVVAEIGLDGLPTGNMIATSSATFDHTGSAVLSFEQDSSGGVARVMSVTVNGTQTLADGAGWTVPALTVSQNILSGAVLVDGLTVRRMFYTQPNQLWARWTDTFTNSTGAVQTRTVHYDSTLGSDGAGVIYATPGAGGKALTSWDRTGGLNGDRDLGLVFGTGASLPTYTSATATAPGSTDIRVSHTITVPANGSVTLVNFVILNGTDTGFGGTPAAPTPVTARATAIDAVAADIASNFRSKVIYQRGMTQAQINTLKNF